MASTNTKIQLSHAHGSDWDAPSARVRRCDRAGKYIRRGTYTLVILAAPGIWQIVTAIRAFPAAALAVHPRLTALPDMRMNVMRPMRLHLF